MNIQKFINTFKEQGFNCFVGTQNPLFAACFQAFEDTDIFITAYDIQECKSLCKGFVLNDKKVVLFATLDEIKSLLNYKKFIEENANIFFVVWNKNISNEEINELTVEKDILLRLHSEFKQNVAAIGNTHNEWLIYNNGIFLCEDKLFHNLDDFNLNSSTDPVKDEIIDFVVEATKEKNCKIYFSDDEYSAIPMLLADCLSETERKIRIAFDDRKEVTKNFMKLSSVGYRNLENIVYFVFNKRDDVNKDLKDIKFMELLIASNFGTIVAASLQDVKDVIDQLFTEFEDDEDNNSFCVFVEY